MRKLLCLLITIIMAFAAVTASADSGLRSAELVGKWYAVFELEPLMRHGQRIQTAVPLVKEGR